MAFDLKNNYRLILYPVMAGLIFYIGYSLFGMFEKVLMDELAYSAMKKKALPTLIYLVCFCVFLVFAIPIFRRFVETQNWLVHSVKENFGNLRVNGFSPLIASGNNTDNLEKTCRWPWGSHHTEYLGHLEAAARKWWVLYDPSDPTTAPTNDMVSDWLQSERKLSREKARAIASMLRPDGLPTGPRR